MGDAMSHVLSGVVVALALAACSQSSQPAPVTVAAAPPMPPAATVQPPASPEPADLTPDQFFESASRSVVIVMNPDAESMGSGVEIKAGLFVTNCHVLEGGTRFYIKRNGRRAAASLSNAAIQHDICLLRARVSDSHPVEVRSASTVRVGERVYTLGNPEGFELTLAEGIVSQLRKANPTELFPYIQTTAAISRGSSGGGVFDSSGKLIGITSFMSKEGQNLNFAAPIDWAVELASATPPNQAVAAEQAEEPQDDSPTALNTRAIALIGAGSSDEAIPILEQALGSDPTNAEFRGNLGYAYLQSRRYQDAKTQLMLALKAAPKRASTWLNLGQTLAELGESDLAVRTVLNGYQLATHKEAVRAGLEKAKNNPNESFKWREIAEQALTQLGAD